MESSVPAHILVLAHKTASAPELLDAVHSRAMGGPCRFTLVVPRPAPGLHRIVDPEDQSDENAEEVLANALPRLTEAAGSTVTGLIGDAAPLTALEDALNAHHFDEIIISTLPQRISRWLRLDLPSKAASFGLPVTTITIKEPTTASVG